MVRGDERTGALATVTQITEPWDKMSRRSGLGDAPELLAVFRFAKKLENRS